MKRAFIIHGWGGNPNERWLVWLKRELEKRGFKVEVPAMPDTEHPRIEPWIGKIKEIVKNVDEDCYFVGHSIGCQAIMRYLEQLEKGKKVGGVVFVAPWMELDEATIEEEGEESVEIVKPWVETSINFEKVKSHFYKSISIFSVDDPYVPLKQKEIFYKKLNSKIIILENKGHFTEEDGIFELSEALSSVISISK
ncbi:MAG: alpha/beta hydrolase [Nanoarchaeota archaeon]